MYRYDLFQNTRTKGEFLVANRKNAAARRKAMIRIGAILLAILMVGGGLVSALYAFVVSVAAAGEENQTNPIISVGLVYGSDVTASFQTTTKTGGNGFVVGSQSVARDSRDFFPLFKITDTCVSVVIDANLVKSGTSYVKAAESNTAIGGYNVAIDRYFNSYDDLKNYLAAINPNLKTVGYYAFPVVLNGRYTFRIHHFATEAAASSAAANLKSWFSGNKLSVAAPSATGLMVLNPETGAILLEYDCENINHLGLAANQTAAGETVYVQTPAGNLYEGVLAYKRYTSGATDGVSVMNVLSLEQYVCGVLPYEITNSWPLEVQKAFAVAVRSYTLSTMPRHYSTYGFDICNTQHCQAYLGMARTNDTVRQAVRETEGMVMTYNGAFVSSFYSSSTGGCTVGNDDAWGGAALPYLSAIQTPWEKYDSYPNGFLIKEVSPTDLLAYLRDVKGYAFSGSIASVKIDALAKNSSYVYQVSIADANGTAISIKTSDNVRNRLAKYVNSANFVVGKGSVTYTDRSGASKTYTASNASNFIFVSKGYGHGVGFSQYGMYDLGMLGYTYDQIIKAYLPSVTLMTLKQYYS